MNYTLFDFAEDRKALLPLTYMRPISEMRVGITTITEKWQNALSTPTISFLTEPYLQGKYKEESNDATIYINGSLIPNDEIVAVIKQLKAGECLLLDEKPIAFYSEKKISYKLLADKIAAAKKNYLATNAIFIVKPADIFQKNGAILTQDFLQIKKQAVSQPLSATNQLVGNIDNLFIAEGAKVECSILNCSTGPIYIGKDAEVMEGSIIRGPFALGEHAGIKMGAKIYGPTTIGPHCKVGGEVSNCVFFAYSNKGHDGFLGNSVVAEWCNFGADTNTSNLKNNYGDVDVWSYVSEKFEDTGLQFHGLIMGDHAKSGINTMFNTGTVVGVSANVFGSDFPPKFIPSFTWGGAQWLRTFIFDKATEVAEKMMERRQIKLSTEDIAILRYIYNKEEKYRKK